MQEVREILHDAGAEPTLRDVMKVLLGVQSTVEKMQIDFFAIQAKISLLDEKFELLHTDVNLLRTDMDEGFAIVAQEFVDLRAYMDQRFTDFRNKLDRHIEISDDEFAQIKIDFTRYEQGLVRLQGEVELLKTK